MQNQKINMMKRRFRIGELAKELKVKKFVVRFWEKEFDLSASRSEGGQRFYTNDDLTIFAHIKDLLYHQGYTIAGAKAQLEVIPHRKSPHPEAWQEPDLKENNFLTPLPEHIRTQLALLKERLHNLKKRLQS